MVSTALTLNDNVSLSGDTSKLYYVNFGPVTRLESVIIVANCWFLGKTRRLKMNFAHAFVAC